MYCGAGTVLQVLCCRYCDAGTAWCRSCRYSPPSRRLLDERGRKPLSTPCSSTNLTLSIMAASKALHMYQTVKIQVLRRSALKLNAAGIFPMYSTCNTFNSTNCAGVGYYAEYYGVLSDVRQSAEHATRDQARVADGRARKPTWVDDRAELGCLLRMGGVEMEA